MKIRFVLFSLVLLITGALQLNGQVIIGKCGVMDPMPLLERVTEHQKTLAENPIELRGSLTKYVPVTFILVADDNGNGRANEEKVLEQVQKLNADYAPQDMIFYIDEFRYKNSTLIYNEPSNPSAVFAMKQIKDPNALNVFVCQTADTDGESPGLTLGYYSPPNDWVVIRKDRLSGFNGILSHELGHFFSLAHTFSGWECDPYDPAKHGNPVSSLWSPCNGSLRNEFMNHSNCQIAGDRVCDTNPDYNFGFGWSVGGDDCAEYTPVVMDYNGDVIDVTENNFMGYFLNCPDYFFSPSQQSLIQTDFFSASRAYLRTGYVPHLDPVDNNVTYISPINGEDTPTFDQVELNWEAVPGATDYLVIIARNSGFTISVQRFIVQETTLLLDPLVPNVNYYWRIWPFNESQTGAGWAATQNFHTGQSSNVQTISSVDKLDVFPNPVESDREINVVLESSSAFDADISLYDVTGKVAWYHEREHIDAGTITHLVIPVDQAEAGLYILNIRSSEGGIISKKVSIF